MVNRAMLLEAGFSLDLSRTIMNAKILSEFLRASQNSEIAVLATVIDKKREQFITLAKNPQSEESPDYWKMHKFVADISTDMDFYITDKESGEIDTNLILEWVGDTREGVIAQAMGFLSNPDNYFGCEKRIAYFIKDYVGVGISHILDNNKSVWSTGGNWEVEFEYESPVECQPQPKNHRPQSDFFGQKIDLFTEDEMIELGFITGDV